MPSDQATGIAERCPPDISLAKFFGRTLWARRGLAAIAGRSGGDFHLVQGDDVPYQAKQRKIAAGACVAHGGACGG